MNRTYYFNFIEERLNVLADRIKSRGKLNILDFNTHSETFYKYFLKELYQWEVENINENEKNFEAIDLIDHNNKFIIQVSATATKQKIENSLSKNSINNYIDYTFKFISIAKDAKNLKNNTFKIPPNIHFNPSKDIIDKDAILSKIKELHIDDLIKIYEFIKKELVFEIDPIKLVSNLATVINILSKENLNTNESVAEINSFEIEKKISYNNLNDSKIIIKDFSVHYNKLNKIYAEFDLQGKNKSYSVLSFIRQEYAKIKNKFTADALFNEIISKMKETVLNSNNNNVDIGEELDLCVNIIVVDAFIRCKIFENPNNYNYVTT